MNFAQFYRKAQIDRLKKRKRGKTKGQLRQDMADRISTNGYLQYRDPNKVQSSTASNYVAKG